MSRPACLVPLSCFVLCSALSAGSRITRDQAIAQVEACFAASKPDAKPCRNLYEVVDALDDIFNLGDKSVLPAIFKARTQVGNPFSFYDSAILIDPNFFFATLAQMPETVQQSVLTDPFHLFGSRRQTFTKLHPLLISLTETSPDAELVRAYLRSLELRSASCMSPGYYPPDAFPSFMNRQDRECWPIPAVLLGKHPLWSNVAESPTTFRFEKRGPWGGEILIDLTVRADGSGELDVHASGEHYWELNHQTKAVSREQVSKFRSLVEAAKFWELPAESADSGFDGAFWTLEGVQKSRYKVVTRWCPTGPYAEACKYLLKLAHHRLWGRNAC